ncbi:WYL domain-containing protein [Streptomyces sp. SID3343]|uniref:helix-turn-helix transcriptional regulator n=1 Tax=Streptomyces sp. SID3343 TaxID=2690260 RepID=UPI00136BDDCE|nr:WYL domain-containing protein [Streptomyces sp. SID3343]MYV98576.1 WYL domain-containing protein [Streptomyces sp. SID3343]
MRSGRLVALLLHLQTRPRGATAAELAAELEVSIRTVYRDVAALQGSGVPLWTETGPHGGIRLVEGWRTRLDGLTGDEAAALFLSGAPHAADALGLDTVLVAAQTKVMATLPADLRTRAGRVRQRFHLDAPGWFQRDERVPHLTEIATAVWNARRLDVRYARPDREVSRLLDPLGLVLKAGVWYLVARHRADIRSYRVSRVVAATARDERFERPDGFDLGAWWEHSNEEFARSLMRFACVVRVSGEGRSQLSRVFGPAVAAAALAAAGPIDANGWCELRLDAESEEMAAAQLPALGVHMEVVSPPSLRRALAAVGATMAANHRAASTTVATPTTSQE